MISNSWSWREEGKKTGKPVITSVKLTVTPLKSKHLELLFGPLQGLKLIIVPLLLLFLSLNLLLFTCIIFSSFFSQLLLQFFVLLLQLRNLGK